MGDYSRRQELFRRNSGAAYSSRTLLSNLLKTDGSTVADYQPGNYTGGLNASAWLNSIGAAPSLAQASGAAQPTINADGSLTFDGISQYMQMATTLAQPEVVILVGKQITWIAGKYIFDGASVNTMGLRQFTASPDISARVATNATADNTGFILNTKAIVTTVFNGASSYTQVNNAAAVTGTVGVGSGSGMILGVSGDLVQFANFQVSELIILNAIPSAAKLANILALLNAIHRVY